MPIIAPPPDTVYQEEQPPEANLDKQKAWERYRRIQIYINVNNWLCPKCGSTVFGRTKICPYNQKGWYCREPRPKDFVLRRTDV